MRNLLSSAALWTALNSERAPAPPLDSASIGARQETLPVAAVRAFSEADFDSTALPERKKIRLDRAAASRHPDFVPPEALKPRVDFWKRVFTTPQNQVVIIDAWRPWLEYSTLSLPDSVEGLSRAALARKNSRAIETERAKVFGAIRRLALGRTPQGEFEEHIAEIFSSLPDSAEALRKAASSARMVRAQRGARERFEVFIERSGYFSPAMERIWAAVSDHPSELAKLPMIESGYSTGARSRANAVGPWQFLLDPASRCGLTVNALVDERKDPLRSTEAAALYLGRAREALSNWALVTTSFNFGVQGLAHACKRAGSSELSDIIDFACKNGLALFKFDSSNYYAKLLAWLELSAELEQNYPTAKPSAELKFKEVRLKTPYPAAMLINLLATPVEELKLYNPALTERAWRSSIPAGFKLRIPAAVPERYYADVLGNPSTEMAVSRP